MILHIILLLVSGIATILCIATAITQSDNAGQFATSVVLFLLNFFLSIYWGVMISKDLDAQEPQVVEIRTTKRPTIDYVVTNNVDTLYIYTFNKKQIKK